MSLSSCLPPPFQGTAEDPICREPAWSCPGLTRGWRGLEGAQLGKQPGLAGMEHAGASLLCGGRLSWASPAVHHQVMAASPGQSSPPPSPPHPRAARSCIMLLCDLSSPSGFLPYGRCLCPGLCCTPKIKPEASAAPHLLCSHLCGSDLAKTPRTLRPSLRALLWPPSLPGPSSPSSLL